VQKDEIINKYLIGRDAEKVVMALFEIILQNMAGGIEENY
jgi:hypothetical protein